jgi:hypothetical protein
MFGLISILNYVQLLTNIQAQKRGQEIQHAALEEALESKRQQEKFVSDARYFWSLLTTIVSLI